MTKYFHVKVMLPWFQIKTYSLPNDLQKAMKDLTKSDDNWRDFLYHAIINVPFYEKEVQHKYKFYVIPALVLSTFEKNKRCEWITRSQFISRDMIDIKDKKQIKYMQHDYSKTNKYLIKEVLKKVWYKKIKRNVI